MPYADVNGVRLFHTERGDGPPLLCVMGLASDSQGWGLQLDALSERFRTIVFDNRDAGRSTQADADYEIADLAEDTIALADHLGLDRFHLLGYGLALVLVFIGIKMLLLEVYKIPVGVALLGVAALIAGSIVLSVLRPPRPPAGPG